MSDREDDDSEREYSTRDALVAAFEAFDDGKLTADNAHTYELPATQNTPPESADGAVAGADKPAAADGAQENSRDGRRDPATGRFAKGEGEGERKPAAADTTPQQQANQQQQQPTTQQPEQQPASQAQPEPAPQGLSDTAAAIWQTASPEARDYITRTEGVLAQVSEGLKPVFAAARERNLQGFDYAQRLVNADQYLTRDPMNAMLWLLDTYKVDPDALADMAAAKRAGMPVQQPQGQQQNQSFNPAIQSLETQIREISSKLTQREQSEQQQAQAAANARKAAVRAEFDAFASDTTKAPYWKEVEREALALIPSVQCIRPQASVTEVISRAYELACQENTTVKAKIDAGKARQQQTQQRHDRARDISSITDHRGAPGSKPQANGHDKSLRAEIEANWAQFDNR